MYETILVPLDGSATAQIALAHAANLAERFQACLLLLRVTLAPPYPGEALPEAQRLLYIESQAYLRTMAEALRAQGHKVRTMVCEGKAAESIIQQAAQEQVSMIVMATHGWGGVGRWPLGSTAEQVLRGTSVPIMLIRAAQDTQTGHD